MNSVAAHKYQKVLVDMELAVTGEATNDTARIMYEAQIKGGINGR